MSGEMSHDRSVKRRGMFLEALRQGADIKCAKAIAGIRTNIFYTWWKEDEGYQEECKRAMEEHELSLIQKCKAEGPTAWKLLKNMARGRFRDEPETLIQGENVQIVFGIPRPSHKVDGVEIKRIEGVKETDGNG